MPYEITEHEHDIHIRVEADDRAPQLLAAMQECQEGRCTCPTDQYDRLDGMTIEPGADVITVTLHPRDGQHLDVEPLSRCLDYSIEKAGQATTP
jgi:hypothetical protein